MYIYDTLINVWYIQSMYETSINVYMCILPVDIDPDTVVLTYSLVTYILSSGKIFFPLIKRYWLLVLLERVTAKGRSFIFYMDCLCNMSFHKRIEFIHALGDLWYINWYMLRNCSCISDNVFSNFKMYITDTKTRVGSFSSCW